MDERVDTKEENKKKAEKEGKEGVEYGDQDGEKERKIGLIHK